MNFKVKIAKKDNVSLHANIFETEKNNMQYAHLVQVLSAFDKPWVGVEPTSSKKATMKFLKRTKILFHDDEKANLYLC